MESSQPPEWRQGAVAGAARVGENRVTSCVIVQELLGLTRLMSRRLLLVPLAAAAITAGCGDGATRAASGIAPLSMHLIPAPAGVVLDGPVWLSSAHRLVVTYTPPGNGTDAASDHLYTLKLNGSSLTRLRLPAQPGCRLTSQSAAVALAGGQFAYLQECWGQETPHRAKFIRTYDPRTRQVGYLGRYPVPVGAGYFAVSPDLQRGVINNGRSLYERLLWLGRASLERVDLSFSRVGYPSWSPNGQTIALDAVPGGPQASGAAREDLHRNLYLLDRYGHVRRLLVRDLVNAGLSAWSPNGRWLALALQPAHAEAGLYLVNVASGAIHLVLSGDGFGSATWISNRELVASVGVFSNLPGGHGPAGLKRVWLPQLG